MTAATTTAYEPNIEMYDELQPPDSYVFQEGSYRPGDEFVISRYRNGDVASFYKDMKWNFSAYHPRGYSAKLYFSSWCGLVPTAREVEIIGEMKWIIFLVIWKRDGPPLAVSTLAPYMKVMRVLARVANENQCLISHILNCPILLQQSIERVSAPSRRTFFALIRTLIGLGEPEIGFPILGGRTVEDLLVSRRARTEQYKQHPPLPTRLYSALIRLLVEELNDFEGVADRYLSVLEFCGSDVLMGRGYEQQRKQAKRLAITLPKAEVRPAIVELLNQYGLAEYATSKGISNIKGMARGLKEIQLVCKLLILIFSGMRSSEAASLPYFCLEKSNVDGGVLYQILGSTTKLNGGREKVAHWVTCSEGAQAISVAQKIASMIYKMMGVTPENTKDYPLFVSTTYLPFLRGQHSTSRKFAASGLSLHSLHKLVERINLTIEQRDVKELEDIDPHRAWRSEKQFHPGQQWPLTAHQLRRSLALYASSSGLVSLPTLRRQLKHITEVMTRYYASGSVYARNIIDSDKEHFCLQFQMAQPESQALAYIVNVLFSDEPLFGAHGTFVERNLKNSGPKQRVLSDHDKTMHKFKKGEIAFKETALGGCTEVNSCDKKALRSIISCLDCSSAVIKSSKLERVISAQIAVVRQLEAGSIMWRAESVDLEIMQSYRDRIRDQPHLKTP